MIVRARSGDESSIVALLPVLSCAICGRLGGDEFLIVLTHVIAENIGPTVSKFREQLAELSFPFQGKSLSVTASFGVAGFRGKDLGEFRTLVREADQMLYEAKRAGRNLVKVCFR